MKTLLVDMKQSCWWTVVEIDELFINQFEFIIL